MPIYVERHRNGHTVVYVAQLWRNKNKRTHCLSNVRGININIPWLIRHYSGSECNFSSNSRENLSLELALENDFS